MIRAHSRLYAGLTSVIVLAIGVFAIGLVLGTPITAQERAGQSPLPEAPFLAENDTAMQRMMEEMVIKPTGDVDRDFVAMLFPHGCDARACQPPLPSGAAAPMLCAYGPIRGARGAT